ncbi:hypothetical protein [Endozoicomonas sp. SESOKO1]|uniref:hypothetical protein n=1 Tax=Endozoicomonas sp. SESOKO1 TaxID=2828742 RepID=UPI0021477975|nr:hypothetical protein [Endozoicomonas sp. SESOKO1]
MERLDNSIQPFNASSELYSGSSDLTEHYFDGPELMDHGQFVSDQPPTYQGMSVQAMDSSFPVSQTSHHQTLLDNPDLYSLTDYSIEPLQHPDQTSIPGTGIPVRLQSPVDKDESRSSGNNSTATDPAQHGGIAAPNTPGFTDSHIDVFTLVEAELNSRQRQAEAAETGQFEPTNWEKKRDELKAQIDLCHRTGICDESVVSLYSQLYDADRLSRRQSQIDNMKTDMDSGFSDEQYNVSQQAYTAELQRVFRREPAYIDRVRVRRRHRSKSLLT